MRRWVKRGALGFLGLIAIAIAGALVFVHTDRGRDLIRRKLEVALGQVFVGGIHVGRLDGSPFGELVVHDVVIDGPDHRPVITIAKLRGRVGLLGLIDRHLVADDVIAEGVEIDSARRDANGELVLSNLLVPRDPRQPGWTFDLHAVALRRAHVAVPGANLDGLTVIGSAHIVSGKQRVANLEIAGTWRERGLPVSLATSVRDDLVKVSASRISAQIGGVTVAGTNVTIARRVGHAPRLGGRVQVIASRGAAAAIDPRLALPGDIAIELAAATTERAATPIALSGAFDRTAIRGNLDVDLDAHHVAGTIETGELDLARLTDGKVAARAGGTVAIDAKPGAATVRVVGHGRYEDLPVAMFDATASARGETATVTLAVGGPATATIAAELSRAGRVVRLDHATVVAAIADPARASAGRLPVHGAIDLALTASGTMSPEPTLAVAGTVRGRHVQLRDLSIGALELAIDATGLPARPAATAHLRASDLARRDRRIASVDLTGHVASPARGELAFDVRSADRSLQASGTYARGGDLAIRVDAERVALDTIARGHAGTVAVHGDATRVAHRWTGTLDVDGAGIAIAGERLGVRVKAAVRPGTAHVSATASGGALGGADVTVDLATPERIDDVAAWEQRGRDAIERADVRLHRLDVARVAKLAGRDVRVIGVLDGVLALGPHTASGDLHVRGARSPELTARGIGAIDADLALGQHARDELAATVTVAVAGIGNATGEARIAMPDRVFDPRAWRALGARVLRGATIRAERIAVDPALLARLGVDSTLRTRASIAVEIGDAAESIDVRARAEDLRGSSLARPVTVDARATIAGARTSGSLVISEHARPLAVIDGWMPVSLAELRTAPGALRSRAVTATLVLPNTPAADLLAVFGRSEIVGGTIDGRVAIGGTLGDPTIAAHVVGADLAVPPGPHGIPVKIVHRIALDATGTLRHADVTIEGSEDRDGKLSVTASVDATSLATATARIRSHAFDLAPLFAFAPGPAGGARGTLDADLLVRGFDVRTAHVSGEAHLSNARIPLAPTVGTLRDAKIDIALHEHDIAIATTGKLGRGDVKLSGTIALDGVTLDGGKVKITLRKVSPIGAVEPVIDADIDVHLARTGSRWNADVDIEHGVVNVTARKGEKIKPSQNPSDLTIGHGRPPRVAGARPSGSIDPIVVANVKIGTTRVQSDEFRTTLDGKLAVTVGADAVGIVGDIVAQSGDLDLFERRYHVEQAAVHFDGGLDPILAIRFTHDFRDVVTVTTVQGRLSKPRLELSSDPGTYSQSELLGFLLGGEPNGDPNSASAQSKLTGAGTSLIAGQIGGYVKRALPFDVDVIRYEVASASSSAAITVGTWLTHTLFFAYRQHLAARPDENTAEGTVEYWLTKRIEIEGTIGDRGYDAVDILWRKRF